MARKAKGLVLYLNCGSDYSITDNKGKVYTTEEAKAAWESGQVADYNVGFLRLVNCGWDVNEVKAQFKVMDAARRA
jgi:hypothetical protein